MDANQFRSPSNANFSIDMLARTWSSDLSDDFIKKGNCRGVDVSLFFPNRGEPTKEAMSYCNGRVGSRFGPDLRPCPVKEECLEYSLSLPSVLSGVWGGKSQRDRRYIRAERERLRNGPQPVTLRRAS